MTYPSQNLDRAMIRFPDGMKPMLQTKAQAGYRSFNAEVIALIERGLAAEKSASAPTA